MSFFVVVVVLIIINNDYGMASMTKTAATYM